MLSHSAEYNSACYIGILDWLNLPRCFTVVIDSPMVCVKVFVHISIIITNETHVGLVSNCRIWLGMRDSKRPWRSRHRSRSKLKLCRHSLSNCHWQFSPNHGPVTVCAKALILAIEKAPHRFREGCFFYGWARGTIVERIMV